MNLLNIVIAVLAGLAVWLSISYFGLRLLHKRLALRLAQQDPSLDKVSIASAEAGIKLVASVLGFGVGVGVAFAIPS